VHPGGGDPRSYCGQWNCRYGILEDLPDVDAVIVPYGGGGLISGIASAIGALKPGTKIFASETSTACPLSRSLEARTPQKIDYVPSFIDGIGSSGLLAEMWPLVSSLVNASIVISPEE